MKYFSTNRNTPPVDFRSAALVGLAPDGGLFFPERIPGLKDKILRNPGRFSKAELAYEIIRPYVGETIPEKELRQICEETIDFDFPLVRVTDRIWSLELFHGPTLAFKDVGARFMSRCLGYFARETQKATTVLVATSGDTGGAVAHSFYGVEGIDVVILYPSGKVSNVQELQLTTLGKNIRAFEVEGTFDDCQRMVKQAFSDPSLVENVQLVSANSINISRWLSQQFYYFYALQQWPFEEPPVISVPSGNFGNICAGMVAHASGLPVRKFIAACNANDTFPEYIRTGKYVPKPAVPTLSNAMDVGNPSNFVRLLELYANNYEKIRGCILTASVSDEETAATIRRVDRDNHYLLEPHGAVAFRCLESYLEKHPGERGILLETAHPVKFDQVVESIIERRISVPESLSELMSKEKESTRILPEYEQLRKILRQY